MNHLLVACVLSRQFLLQRVGPQSLSQLYINILNFSSGFGCQVGRTKYELIVLDVK